jgi:hypothetical protein
VVVTVVLVVALTTLAVLVVLSVALVRHLKLLSASMRIFRDQAQPVVEDITAGVSALQERLDRMAQRTADRKR